MQKLFVTKMNRSGVGIAMLALVIGFTILRLEIPFLKAFSIFTGGIIGLFALFGTEGMTATFKKPKNFIKTFILGFLSTYLLSALLGLFTLNILHLPFASNKAVGRITVPFLIESLPRILGEELLVIVILVVIVNLMGKSKKAILVGILVSTLIFSLVHLPNYNWNILQCLLLLSPGRVIITLASLKSDSVWTGFAAHVAYDWIQFLASMSLLLLIL